MGIAYLAEQTQPIRGDVTLKVLKSGGSANVFARFQTERQALALMDHPNIARVLDAGISAKGRGIDFLAEFAQHLRLPAR